MLRASTFAFVFVLLSQVVFSQDTSLREVKEAFDNANIPEDIDLPFDPRFLLEVSFSQTSGDEIVLKAGVQLPRDKTVGPPSFTIVGRGVSDGPFVIAVVDPDAPTPQNPTSAQVRQFLGGNFEGDCDSSLLSPGIVVLKNTTAAVTNWRQPAPPAGSDAHRYIFLAFNQPQGFNDQTVVGATTPITMFSIKEFSEKVGLGDPIAGTFMLVAPDPA
ncbi:PEBP-like protein [Desarmillaria tabescens]|uniref:PEBP-like protein n=1 Tax=Armillaria tabescens TaxID=1929756 RepID=A0AA39KHH1_ARMTA|nr:PEBP-like protein [Desarmillaria tabescens]KAK0460046.1 PEBP-like protein [Desarmillaria tabescens]